MAITEAFTLNNVTPSGTTELSIPRNATYDVAQPQTTDGVFQLWIDDQTNMTKTEEYAIRIYEKVESGGTSKQVFLATLKGVQAEIFCTPMLILMNGWDMTIKKIAGTDRAFDASIRQIS